MSDAGPIELVYSVVGNVLDSVQNAAHLQSISDFIGSIRWQEPFILGIIGLQFFLFVVTYLTRKNDILQFSILFCLTLVALAAERLNDYGRAYWRQFASQDYFDRAGLFMLIFVCGPFIILANFIAVRSKYYFHYIGVLHAPLALI